MIDVTFGSPVADILKPIKVVKVMTTMEFGFDSHTPDKEIIAKIADENWILLTHDRNTINEYEYPPCSHAGIIIVRAKRWSKEKICERIKAFCRSGNKKCARHCVTYLHAEGATIHKHKEVKKAALLIIL